jgi:Ca2+-binding EF-hand superfamily protein
MGCGASSQKPELAEPVPEKDKPSTIDSLIESEHLQPAAADSATVVLPGDVTEEGIETESIGTEKDRQEANVGIAVDFSPLGGGTGKTIVAGATGARDQAGSLLQSDGQRLMGQIDLGGLHGALQGEALVSEAKFKNALEALLPASDRPSSANVSALFHAFDVDSSGEIDQKELIAGCQALCMGNEATKLRLAFSCFDGDGDGHLSAAELKTLLRGTIAPAVSQLHSAIDFASFGAEGDEMVGAVNEEAAGAATLTADEVTETGERRVKVELTTKLGVVTIHAPAAAISSAAPEVGALSLDAFLNSLVEGALAKYDADANGTIEMEEFVSFAKENPFLSVWFGHLTEEPQNTASWKDDFNVS